MKRILAISVICGLLICLMSAVSFPAVAEETANEPVNLIAGKEPLNNYLAYANDPSRKSGNIVKCFLDIYPNQEWTNLTDGDDESACFMHCWYGANSSGVNLVDWRGVGYNTHWPVLIYTLDGMATIDEIRLTSPSSGDESKDEAQELYTAGVDYYVADRMVNLFKEENRVYTTNGYTMLPSETGEKILDPAYDVLDKTISCKLPQGTVGRYVAVVITRMYPVQRLGWSVSRVSEIEILGQEPEEKDPVFDTSTQTVTDKATGISATISRIDVDDLDFFDRLGGLRVTRSAIPAGAADSLKNVSTNGYNWLTTDSDMFTLQLLDKQGNPISDADIGERYWTLSIPTQADYFRTLGLYDEEDGLLHRVINATSDKNFTKVTAGMPTDACKNDYATLTGSCQKLVLLKYNSLETINALNGDTRQKGVSVYSVNGAQDEKNAPVLPIFLAAFASIIICALVCILLRRCAVSRKGGADR